MTGSVLSIQWLEATRAHAAVRLSQSISRPETPSGLEDRGVGGGTVGEALQRSLPQQSSTHVLLACLHNVNFTSLLSQYALVPQGLLKS